MQNVSVLRKILKLFTDAGTAFDKISEEKGIYISFTVLACTLAIKHFIDLIVQVLLYNASQFKELFPEIFATNILMIFFATLMFSFVLTLVVHLFVFMFGGRGIANTYKIIAYSFVPFLILSLIPLIGQFSILITIFLVGYGLHRVHGLSPFKSGLSVGIPLILGYLIMQLIGAYILTTFGI